MATIEHEIHIDATPEEVWAVLADLAGFADWSPVVRRVEHDGARGVGATRTCHVIPMGRLREEVVAWEPDRAVALRTTGGMPMEAVATWRVEADGAGSRASVVLDYRVKGGALGRLADRAMVHGQMDRNFARNLDGLRQHVEAAATAVERPAR